MTSSALPLHCILLFLIPSLQIGTHTVIHQHSDCVFSKAACMPLDLCITGVGRDLEGSLSPTSCRAVPYNRSHRSASSQVFLSPYPTISEPCRARGRAVVVLALCKGWLWHSGCFSAYVDCERCFSFPFQQRLTKHTKFVRDMIREVCGFAPYERRAMELLKVSKDKRALKFIKKRVRVNLML